MEDMISLAVDTQNHFSPDCTILWVKGETTYLKGKNALRIARTWLETDPDCLMVYSAGWLYLKGGDQK